MSSSGRQLLGEQEYNAVSDILSGSDPVQESKAVEAAPVRDPTHREPSTPPQSATPTADAPPAPAPLNEKVKEWLSDVVARALDDVPVEDPARREAIEDQVYAAALAGRLGSGRLSVELAKDVNEMARRLAAGGSVGQISVPPVDGEVEPVTTEPELEPEPAKVEEPEPTTVEEPIAVPPEHLGLEPMELAPEEEPEEEEPEELEPEEEPRRGDEDDFEAPWEQAGGFGPRLISRLPVIAAVGPLFIEGVIIDADETGVLIETSKGPRRCPLDAVCPVRKDALELVTKLGVEKALDQLVEDNNEFRWEFLTRGKESSHDRSDERRVQRAAGAGHGPDPSGVQ